MEDVLRKIMDRKAERLAEAKRARPLAELERSLAAGRARADTRFADALARDGRVKVIAEVKRASPSKGVIRDDLAPADVAEAYAPWAAAISVLTEEDFFLGSLEALRAARARVRVPLLRKDFVFDEYQLVEAAEAGADAALLIAAALEPSRLVDLLGVARDVDLDVLVEVHSPGEFDAVVDSGHLLVGVNNRNLKTFEVDVETSYRIARMAPAGTLLVSESGIESREEIDRLTDAGFHAFLIGEHLMRAPQPGEALRALVE
jgi:indole-3-glycerol phosphate synthase